MPIVYESPTDRRAKQLRGLRDQLHDFQQLVATAENHVFDGTFKQPERAKFLRRARDLQTRLSSLTEGIYS